MKLSSNDYRVETSARHVHLSQTDFVALFGADAKLSVVKPLSVKGEFKSDKTVTIVGTKRNFEKVAVLGPFRHQTQVEISVTDSYTLGIKDIPVRMSGDLHDSAPVTLVGTNSTINLPEGMIIAQRHLHINSGDMQKMGLADGEMVEIVLGTARKITFHNVVVRQSDVDFPTVHLDTDEANAAQ
ncbi:MAG: propanediol utilization protein [Clostridia bacterium]|nr:propanediol utilization protein [Clostridia bacterium]